MDAFDPPPPPIPPEPPAPASRASALRLRTGGRAGFALSWATVAVGLGLLALTLVGREASAPHAAISAGVTFLPYLYAGYAAWCFALWSVVPDRREPPVALGAAVFVAASTWGPAWGARPEAAPGQDLRMMSWNLRRLWGGPEDGGDPLKCAVDTIAARSPDVLTLLEVSRADVDRLSAALDLDCVHTTYLESDSPKKGGLAACTRGDRWRLRDGAAQRFVDDEDWYYVFTEVERDGEVFNLLAVHLYPYAFAARKLREGVEDLARFETDELTELTREGSQIVKAQSDQSAALLERVSRFRDPTVVAGDFNSTRDAALHASLRRTLVDTFERGGVGFGGTIRFMDQVPLRIDYVYASQAFAVRGSEVLQVGCSDHRPVVSDLTLRSAR